MATNWKSSVCSVVLAVVLLAGAGSLLQAQSGGGDAPRKIKSAVRPEYSPLAKRLNLSGTVRIEVHIGPDGKVNKTRVVGGHPVLGMDAEQAALKTIFEPGPKETTQVIEFRFDPQY